jgi:ABC-type uncharacterized transport system substrate-binding protein
VKRRQFITQVSDPVGSGFVAGLARPGANISGFQNFEPAMGGKRLGVLKEAAPNMRRAAVLFGSDSVATVALLRAAEAVAPALAVEVTAVDIHGGVEIERAISTFASQPDGGLIVTLHPSFVSNLPAARRSVASNSRSSRALRPRDDRTRFVPAPLRRGQHGSLNESACPARREPRRM